eukprot:6410698-Prymnesium_polylepis.1
MLCATRSAVARAPCGYAMFLESLRGAPRSAVAKVLGKGRFATFWSRLRNLHERAVIRLVSPRRILSDFAVILSDFE